MARKTSWFAKSLGIAVIRRNYYPLLSIHYMKIIMQGKDLALYYQNFLQSKAIQCKHLKIGGSTQIKYANDTSIADLLLLLTKIYLGGLKRRTPKKIVCE